MAEHSHATHRRTARPLSLRSIIVVALLAATSFACGGGDSAPTTPNTLIDTSIRSGAGVLKVLPINDSDSNKGTAPLQPGGSTTLGAVTVSFLSQNASGDRVRVVR